MVVLWLRVFCSLWVVWCGFWCFGDFVVFRLHLGWFSVVWFCYFGVFILVLVGAWFSLFCLWLLWVCELVILVVGVG